MRHCATLLVALSASSGLVTGLPVAALPAPSTPESYPADDVKHAQSNAFGWQLAGAATDSKTLDLTCSKLQNGEASKWGQMGLFTNSIETPVCTGQAPDAKSALPEVAAANTKAFTALITNSFDKSNLSTYNYLCKNIRFVQLNGFLLDAPTIVNATCRIAGTQRSPQAFVPLDGAKVVPSAVASYNSAQSKIFATLSAASAATPAELQQLCTKMGTAPGYGALQLSTNCVKDTICGVTKPLTADQGRQALQEWTTRAFLAVVQNMSNAPGYGDWLCQNLDVDAMCAVGLDGHLAKNTVCGV